MDTSGVHTLRFHFANSPLTLALVLAFALVAGACGPVDELSESDDSSVVATTPQRPTPETTAPETTAPEMNTPEPTKPESATPEPTAREMTAPETTTAEAAEMPPASDTPATAVAEAAPMSVILPSADVVDLVSGADINLNSIALPGPLLAWFWAPH